MTLRNRMRLSHQVSAVKIVRRDPVEKTVAAASIVAVVVAIAVLAGTGLLIAAGGRIAAGSGAKVDGPWAGVRLKVPPISKSRN